MLEKLFLPNFMQKDANSESELVGKWGEGFKYLLGKFNQEELPANESNALLFNTVYSCSNVLSDDVAKLPIHVFKKVDGKIERITGTDVHRVLRVRPNNYMTPFDWVKLIMTDLNVHGNHFTAINIFDNGEIKNLVPLDPTTTRPRLAEDGNLYFQSNINGKIVVLNNEQVIHIKGVTTNGLNGLSPIQAIKVQLESNDIAGKYNKNMIKEGGTPQGVLEAQGILDKDAKRMVREGWESVNRNKNIAVVDQNVTYKQTGISQADMQWLEAQRFNVQQIAAIYKMPLHKINDLENATYTNIEHQSIDYVKNTLQPWVTKIEQELNYKLFTPTQVKEGYYVKFNMDSELRGDSLARARVNQINVNNGMKTINEIRALNEDSPFEGDYANKAWMTLNSVPAENAEDYQKNKFGQSLRAEVDNILDERSKDNQYEEWC